MFFLEKITVNIIKILVFVAVIIIIAKFYKEILKKIISHFSSFQKSINSEKDFELLVEEKKSELREKYSIELNRQKDSNVNKTNTNSITGHQLISIDKVYLKRFQELSKISNENKDEKIIKEISEIKTTLSFFDSLQWGESMQLKQIAKELYDEYSITVSTNEIAIIITKMHEIIDINKFFNNELFDFDDFKNYIKNYIFYYLPIINDSNSYLQKLIESFAQTTNSDCLHILYAYHYLYFDKIHTSGELKYNSSPRHRQLIQQKFLLLTQNKNKTNKIIESFFLVLDMLRIANISINENLVSKNFEQKKDKRAEVIEILKNKIGIDIQQDDNHIHSLAKKYHPDRFTSLKLNNDFQERININFSILKSIIEKLISF